MLILLENGTVLAERITSAYYIRVICLIITLSFPETTILSEYKLVTQQIQGMSILKYLKCSSNILVKVLLL